MIGLTWMFLLPIPVVAHSHVGSQQWSFKAWVESWAVRLANSFLSWSFWHLLTSDSLVSHRHGATPSFHPFWIGIFHERNYPQFIHFGLGFSMKETTPNSSIFDWDFPWKKLPPIHPFLTGIFHERNYPPIHPFLTGIFHERNYPQFIHFWLGFSMKETTPNSSIFDWDFPWKKLPPIHPFLTGIFHERNYPQFIHFWLGFSMKETTPNSSIFDWDFPWKKLPPIHPFLTGIVHERNYPQFIHFWLGFSMKETTPNSSIWLGFSMKETTPNSSIFDWDFPWKKLPPIHPFLTGIFHERNYPQFIHFWLGFSMKETTPNSSIFDWDFPWKKLPPIHPFLTGDFPWKKPTSYWDTWKPPSWDGGNCIESRDFPGSQLPHWIKGRSTGPGALGFKISGLPLTGAG